MFFSSHLLDRKFGDIVRSDIEANDEADLCGFRFRIPIAGDLLRILPVHDRIENRLFGQAWRPRLHAGFVNEFQLAQASGTVERGQIPLGGFGSRRRLLPDDVLNRHIFRQPNAVVGKIEGATHPVHIPGPYLQNHRLAPALAHLLCGLDVGREMHMVAVTFEQSARQDGIHEAVHRAVIENFRWSLGSQGQVDFHRVTLIGTNPQTVLA